MKRLVYALAVISLSACNSKNSNKEGNQIAASNQLPAIKTTPIANTGQQVNTSGLLTNPAHGQPGHDCALPVGAPLKQNISTSQATAIPTTTTTVPITAQPASSQPVAQQSSSGQKLNPAHGQPGHDCAIAVGAPLKSSKSAPTTTTAPTATVSTATQPAISQPGAQQVTNGQELNPAHGQPGHKCEIAVGAPLT
ncbi:hypothetical protein [Pedobacter ureilyticus]|uniref:Uncharacterized protein n=1 Tax=Pedobacter ureilyticus TaxID=1393051 RepID=A0ABW9J4H0_9SPHI|nr:hypothetical protein [Pedobacter helvus]